jgi:hypothetical protein
MREMLTEKIETGKDLEPKAIVLTFHRLINQSDIKGHAYMKAAKSAATFLCDPANFGKLSAQDCAMAFAFLSKLGANNYYKFKFSLSQLMENLSKRVQRLDEKSALLCLEAVNNFVRVHPGMEDQANRFAYAINSFIVEEVIVKQKQPNFTYLTQYLARLSECRKI